MDGVQRVRRDNEPRSGASRGEPVMSRVLALRTPFMRFVMAAMRNTSFLSAAIVVNAVTNFPLAMWNVQVN